jgi:tetratricopeptide (TPR) repeat protein
MKSMVYVLLMAGVMAASGGTLESARDRQDLPALDKLASEHAAAAERSPKDAEAQYRAALAASYRAEVALELRDKKLAQQAAEQGVKWAERAIAIAPDKAEYHRILGTLCGQVVPANVLLGLSYGKRAKDAIAKAIEKDPRLAGAYVSRGVGNYYLPPSFGGGTQLAIADFRKALELDPKNAAAYLWLGLSLRKEQKNAEARKAFEQSLKLNPDRVWVKQQLEKTPAQ